ncbi:MAG: hypothetical protein ACP5FK_03810 [bacterium]
MKNQEIYKFIADVFLHNDAISISGNEFLKLFISHCRDRWGLLAGEVLRSWQINNYGDLEQYLKTMPLNYQIEITDPNPDRSVKFEDIFSI